MAECYLCGEILLKNINRSKDHIPPDCIFPDNKPKNLLTVYCCKKCNEEFGRLDEKMRNYFGVLAIEKSGEIGEKAYHEIIGSFKFTKDFVSKLKGHPSLRNDQGNPRFTFYFDDQELSSWLIRLTKGLYYKQQNIRISREAIFEVKKYPTLQPQPSNTYPFEKGLEYRPYFIYGVVHENNNDFWGFVFYDSLIFSVSVKI